jgi:hypothetical protein
MAENDALPEDFFDKMEANHINPGAGLSKISQSLGNYFVEDER